MKAFLDQAEADERRDSGMRSLMAAVVDRAVRDAAGMEPRCSTTKAAQAIWFIQDELCRLMCEQIDFDYAVLAGNASKLYRRRLEREAFSCLPAITLNQIRRV
jgi:hypothetical protein